MQIIAQVLFWLALGIIFYTYIGFIIILAIRAYVRPRPFIRGSETPSISLVIVAHNESDYIMKKLENALELDYPTDKLEIIVASDGSDDGMDEMIREANLPQVNLLSFPRAGKNPTLNRAVEQAKGEILVFSDADSMLTKAALRDLSAPFSDPKVGGVGGDYRYETDVVEGRGERTYWGYDRVLRSLQSRGGNLTSTTGQIYAIRRKLFKPVPGGVTDDFFTSVQVPSAHYRLVFEPKAKAFGPVAGSPGSEFKRKARIINRGLNSVWNNRHLLNPFEYGFYSLQLLTHKVLRRLLGIPLILLYVASIFIWDLNAFYTLAFLAQSLVYGLGFIGFVLRKTTIGQARVFSLPLFFIMVYTASLVALYNLLRGKRHDIWDAQRANTPT